MRIILLAFSLLLSSLMIAQQKVGVVLSGGGASGMAHIGVLKALEENNIPIDYITGTSIGALIGGLYASGYSPAEIEVMVTTQEFLDATNGVIDDRYKFFFKKRSENPGMISWNFNLDSTFEANIPTSVVSSTPIDFGLMVYLSGPSAAASNNFDNLLIPFRCIGSNITDRKQTIFRSGDLASSIRASMTYPFYLSPIEIDGKIMFDGGLYNNFPADILCDEFSPDFVIASNVTSAIEAPSEDNLLSQVKNMLIREPDFNIKCSDGIIINSEVTDISTFEFDQNNIAISRGYESAMAILDSIKSKITEFKNPEELKASRAKFKSKIPDLAFESLDFQNYHPKQAKQFLHKVKPNQTSFDIEELTKPFFRLGSDEKIKSIYPKATFNKETNLFNLVLKVKEEKDFIATFGGVISSKPFSTGFFQMDFNRLKANQFNAFGNIFFGKFYNSAKAGVRYDIPFDIPFYLEGDFTINQYDFFNSLSTFIDEIDQPYIITSEQFATAKIGLPAINKGKITFGLTYNWNEINYYQSNDFERGDTSDITEFEGYSTFAAYELNSFNRKTYATKGEKASFSIRQVNGREKTVPGSTSINKERFKKKHNWLVLKMSFEKYFLKNKPFHFGLLAEGVYSDQPNFQNYTATVLNAPSFRPLPEMKTIFQEQYRAFSFIGVGLRSIYSLNKNIDLRAEVYVFQPYEELSRDNFGSTSKGEEVAVRDFIGTFTTVYHTRVGPLAASLNYYDDANQELSFLIHFGYILFNKNSGE